MKRALVLISAGLLLLACNEEQGAQPEKPAAATTAPAAASGEVAEADDAEDIPTEADFEDEAETAGHLGRDKGACWR